jgi:hypothetical protein
VDQDDLVPIAGSLETEREGAALAEPAVPLAVLGDHGRPRPPERRRDPRPLIVVDPAADQLLDALMSVELQELAWAKHGFRGPLGTATGAADQAIAGLLPAEIEAVLPMPAADVMLALLAGLGA